jgi:hypothetical protein
LLKSILAKGSNAQGEFAGNDVVVLEYTFDKHVERINKQKEKHKSTNKNLLDQLFDSLSFCFLDIFLSIVFLEYTPESIVFLATANDLKMIPSIYI